MLKTVKMMSLCFLAAAMCEQTALSIPSSVLHTKGPVYHVTVSAYANTPQCTASRRGVMSSAIKIRPEHCGKVIALSRDIARNYNYGDRFDLYTKGKLYVVCFQDRMPAKHHRKVDLLLPSLKSCRQFGRGSGVLVPLEKT